MQPKDKGHPSMTWAQVPVQCAHKAINTTSSHWNYRRKKGGVNNPDLSLFLV